MTNGRGRTIRIDGPAIEWAVPVIVLLRRDWGFLFDQLRSTQAVIGYLHRVAE